MDGEYLDTKTRNQTTIVILDPGTMISPSGREKFPPWSIGATDIIKGKIIVPVGTFSHYLKNCTMVKGKNLNEVLWKGAKPEYQEGEDFGRFRTESFYVEGVGLVREVQYDAGENVSYILELKSFKVN